MTSQVVIPNWLDEQFITRALRETEENRIKVKQIQVRAATSPGDNYASVMYRVTVEYEVDNGYDLTDCRKSLIVKAILENENMNKLTTEMNVFGTEAEVLCKIMPAMQQLLNPSSFGKQVLLAPKCYLFSANPPQNIVMEDLCQSGYKMAQRIPGLDLDHSKLVVSRLGMFHAASVALKYEDQNIFDKFSTHIFVKAGDSFMNMVKQTLNAVTETVQTWPDSGHMYSEKLRQFSEIAAQKILRCVERDNQGFNVLTHGDAWTNNMMFKYNEDGHVSDMIFLDFQCCYYGSPALDLNYFMYTSPTPDVRSHYMDNLIECYHSSFSNTLARLGCKVKCPSLDELQADIKNRGFLKTISFLCIRPIMTANSDCIPDIDSMMDDSAPLTSRAYLTEDYKKELRTVLPTLINDGLFG